MTKLILALGLVTIMTALAGVACAQPVDRGITVLYEDGTDGGGACAAFVRSCGEQSCELIVDTTCSMTLAQCLEAIVYMPDSEEGEDALGCSPDARLIDVDNVPAARRVEVGK